MNQGAYSLCWEKVIRGSELHAIPFSKHFSHFQSKGRGRYFVILTLHVRPCKSVTEVTIRLLAIAVREIILIYGTDEHSAYKGCDLTLIPINKRFRELSC